MGKFIIECPSCHSYAEASSGLWGTGLFAKKMIPCKCGNNISVKQDKFILRNCPSCKNNVLFDQSKGDKAVCPVCKNLLNTGASLNNRVSFHCPTCTCNLEADKSAAEYTCPVCDTKIDVQREVKRAEERNKGIASDIKYEGDNQTLVWKHPITDFNLGSQLTVYESQEAVFFRDGQALDLFGPGRYTLVTQNLPLLEDLYKLPTNNETIFHSHVYFINKTVQMGVKWGTDSKINYIDAKTGIPFAIGASGTYNICVSDSRKLLVKLVGTSNELNLKGQDLEGGYSVENSIYKFRPMIITIVKNNWARIMKEYEISILEIDSSIDLIQTQLLNAINEKMSEYGLLVTEFLIPKVMLPVDDPNFIEYKKQQAVQLDINRERNLQAIAEAAMARKAVEAQTEAQMKIIGAQGDAEAYRLKAEAEAAEMRMKGFTYQQQTAREVGLGAVQNMGGGEGGSGISDLASLGISFGAMGSLMNMTKDALNPAMSGMAQNVGTVMNGGWNCSCGAQNIATPFCPQCGKPKPVEQSGWNCTCGAQNITTPFCPHCGKPKPVEQSGWNCTCGAQNITTPFCPQCGKPKPAEPSTWNCSCGAQNITTAFCPQCGKPKPADD